MNKVEKEKRIAELRAKIDECNQRYNMANAMQLAVKLVLNGTYGAFGNAYFVITNKDIAGAITSMGRDLIQYMVKCNDYYWYRMWHLDVELHEKLGVTDVEQIESTWIHSGTREAIEKPTKLQITTGEVIRKHNVSVYADTDSLFVSFKPAFDSCGFDGDKKDFIFKINEHRLATYFKQRLEDYAEQFNVKNIQDFELERVNESALFLAKKMYIQHVIWEDGAHHEPLTYLYPKGVQLVKGSTPPFARTKVKEIIKYLFAHPDDYSVGSLLNLVKDIKKQFRMADIEEISQSGSCSNYDEFVEDDKEDFILKEKTHYYVSMAAYHNYLLNQTPECKNKYNYIKSGVKFKYYSCESQQNKYFAYIRGQYPQEFAPPVDYDTQFEKTVLAQVNAFVTALGMPELKKRLSVVFDLFDGV